MRKLSAIMFTDIVGYTALMQADESRAKLLRDKHRNVLENFIQSYNGKIIQYYGDGTLSIFNSAVEAVNSAVEIQRKLREEPKIPLRIGIHIGDIVHEDEGVYGDGVNVASRIESLAVPGAIFISGKLFDELNSHPFLKAKLMGKYRLKNVAKIIGVYAVESDGIIVPSPSEINAASENAVKSIAVLPFINMSTDPENEYFSDGITEEILNALVKVEGLKVTARTSSFAFKGMHKDIREIGRQLDVNTVLEGSVRKYGNRVRITAQLINTTDGYHIWSDVYNRNLEDIFQVQDEISHKIVNTLREKLTGNIKEHLVSAPTKNLDAYNLYLKGQYNMYKWNPEGARRGIKFLEQAITIEPNLAVAHSALAFCYTMLGAMGQFPSRRAFRVAEQYAEKAMTIDSTLPEVLISKALIEIFYRWNLNSAEKYLNKVLQLYPGNAGVHHAYAIYLVAANRLENAVEHLNTALNLDPLSLPINHSLGETYLLNGQYNKALDQLVKTLELDPGFRAAVETKGWVYFFMGDIENSINTFQQFYNLTEDPLKGVTGLGYVYAQAGFIDQAKGCLKKLEERKLRDKDISLNSDFVMIYAGLEDYDNVFKYLENDFTDGNSMYFILTHPACKKIREQPQFNRLIKGNSQYQ